MYQIHSILLSALKVTSWPLMLVYQLTHHHITTTSSSSSSQLLSWSLSLFTSDKEEVNAIARDVCLSVSKITQKCVHGFGWNFVCRQVSGHERIDQFLSPIWIIVRMSEPENLKVEDLSKSVKQAPHSEQATGYRMHCWEILFTPCCSPRAREFPRSVDFSVWRTVAELRGGV